MCEAPTFVAGAEDARAQLPSTATVAQVEKKLKELDRAPRRRGGAAPAPVAQPAPAALNLDLVLATRPARNVTRALATKVRRGGAERGQSARVPLGPRPSRGPPRRRPAQSADIHVRGPDRRWRVLLAAPSALGLGGRLLRAMYHVPSELSSRTSQSCLRDTYPPPKRWDEW